MLEHRHTLRFVANPEDDTQATPRNAHIARGEHYEEGFGQDANAWYAQVRTNNAVSRDAPQTFTPNLKCLEVDMNKAPAAERAGDR